MPPSTKRPTTTATILIPGMRYSEVLRVIKNQRAAEKAATEQAARAARKEARVASRAWRSCLEQLPSGTDTHLTTFTWVAKQRSLFGLQEEARIQLYAELDSHYLGLIYMDWAGAGVHEMKDWYEGRGQGTAAVESRNEAEATFEELKVEEDGVQEKDVESDDRSNSRPSGSNT